MIISQKKAINKGYIYCHSLQTKQVYKIDSDLPAGTYRVLENEGYTSGGVFCHYVTLYIFKI